ncbi:NUDIX hydrolase [Sinimarinibacterium thermocellulolyticum]|uniref:Phosphatase NudJ n=1 Tax=Sinimarinibacterium thermocellulolyticum TaxID=3170016 RepID=A0ABV2AE50_9GAMM
MSWTPHVVVACVVERDGRFLLVEESVNGEILLNQPAGHWEQGESLMDGAKRETLEETRWEVEPTHVLGLYHVDPPGLGYGFLRIAFAAELRREHAERALDQGIVRVLWLTREELVARRARHRSPMVLRCVDDWLAGKRYPLDLVAHL